MIEAAQAKKEKDAQVHQANLQSQLAFQLQLPWPPHLGPQKKGRPTRRALWDNKLVEAVRQVSQLPHLPEWWRQTCQQKLAAGSPPNSWNGRDSLQAFIELPSEPVLAAAGEDGADDRSEESDSGSDASEKEVTIG